MPEETPKTESNPPPGTAKAFALRLKSLATLITAIAALTIAVGKACQAPQEPAAKAAYNELAEAVKANSESASRNHDDIVGLRGYLDGVLKSEGIIPVNDAGTFPTTFTDAGKVTIVTQATPTTSTTAVAVLVPLDRSKLKPPPPVSTKPVVYQPPSFDNVSSKK